MRLYFVPLKRYAHRWVDGFGRRVDSPRSADDTASSPPSSEGACEVRWRDLQTKRTRAVFRRRGARYKATYRGFFNTTCGGAPSTSVVRSASEWRPLE
jgi:hypothetical protein